MPKKSNKPNNKPKSAPQAPSATAKLSDERNNEHVLLSKHTHDYAKAVADPFDSAACGIPSYPSLPSLKVKTWSKGTLSTSSTTGFGFVVADPRGGVVNDFPVVLASDASYANNFVGDLASGAVASYANAPYSVAAMNDTGTGVSFRVVAFGLRMRYIGTELNRGGYKVALVDPTNTTLITRTIPQFEAETQSVRFAIDRKWTTVLYHPVRQAQLSFNSSMAGGVGAGAPSASGNTSDDLAYWLGFAIQAASATTPLQYEFEAYTIVEYQGAISTGQTVTLYDPVGHAAVDASMMNTKALRPSNIPSPERISSTLQSVSHYVKHGISSYQAIKSVASDVHKMVRPASSSGSSSWWSTALNWIESLAPALALV